MSEFFKEMSTELREAGFDQLDEQQLKLLVDFIGATALAATHDSEIFNMVMEHFK